MMQISFGVSNSTVLMKPWPMTPRKRSRQESEKHAEHEAARARVPRQIGQNLQQPPEIDGEDGEDRAELDQDLEGLAGRLEAEEMTGEQYVPGRGNRDEFGQALQQAEHEGVDERLIFHDFPYLRERPLLLVTAWNRPYRSMRRGDP